MTAKRCICKTKSGSFSTTTEKRIVLPWDTPRVFLSTYVASKCTTPLPFSSSYASGEGRVQSIFFLLITNCAHLSDFWGFFFSYSLKSVVETYQSFLSKLHSFFRHAARKHLIGMAFSNQLMPDPLDLV